ncbi:MAG: SRPBCC family protein [Candidatus Latescibacteria bacterium]|nr:SRPBCC family protein [Candidatus Latescibacterota bacterium]
MITQPIKIAQTFTVHPPLETVWGFLRDPESFASCIPGVERVEAIDERTFKATVTVKIMLVTARFRIVVRITEEQPPLSLVSTIDGDDEKTRSGLEMTNTLTLRSFVSGGTHEGTEVAYQIDARLSGKLAALGGGIAVKLKASQMGREFAQEVRRRVER